MSRIVRILLVAALLFGTFAVMQPQVAQAQTQFPAYVSGIQVANLDTTAAASISITAYKASDGTQDGQPLADSIDPGASKSYFPISNVQQGFSGSIVISSNKSVAAISNILSSSFSAGAAYVGRAGGSNTVLLPLLNKNNGGYFTWFSVQNAGGSDANITIDYSSSLPNVTATIRPGAAKVFYQAQENHDVPRFAATITSNQPIVAAVIQENPKTMFAYTGFSSGATNPVFPLINANNSGYVTGLQIQNAGTQATQVTVTYKPSPNGQGGTIGTECTETQTIQPGNSNTFALLAFLRDDGDASTTDNCADGVRFIGSAQVTANSTSQPLVGVGNQLLPNVNGEAYGAFSQADGGRTVVLPLIMDRNSGFYTGFNIMNIGTAATDISCSFSNSSVTVSASGVQPGAAMNDIQFNKLANGYVGSATCTGSAADAKLVAVVNELKSGAVDNLLVYEGIRADNP